MKKNYAYLVDFQNMALQLIITRLCFEVNKNYQNL